MLAGPIYCTLRCTLTGGSILQAQRAVGFIPTPGGPAACAAPAGPPEQFATRRTVGPPRNMDVPAKIPAKAPETREVINFGGNLRFTPRRYYVPQSEGEVLEILDRHAREQIRVVGSRHAWSEGIVSTDVIIDLCRLNTVEVSEPAPGEILATVGGGCQIKRLLDH